MDRRREVEQLRRSIAMLSPGTRDAIGREDALRLLTELYEVQGHRDAPRAAAAGIGGGGVGDGRQVSPPRAPGSTA
jgi:hypothetical protein